MPPATSAVACQSISDFIRLFVGQPAFCIVLEGETGRAVAWCIYSSCSLWISAPAKIAFQFIPPCLYSPQSHLHSTSSKGPRWTTVYFKESTLLRHPKFSPPNQYRRTLINPNRQIITNNWEEGRIFFKRKRILHIWLHILLDIINVIYTNSPECLICIGQKVVMNSPYM